ncbi:methylmalonyl Co-A mutase-associated GTPase MeaB [Robertkochia solimangrovi]|uniref:methylmalonyl Co-A mutase-associated GTPase MeaB n=1 Tax=Robertkochia solimangrovi TaxID=2213046 RepID=UPI001F54E266|nr:methylmalonyl Co-A mutase-associated GTPase MeaB [Robertkochia solimangrovi]
MSDQTPLHSTDPDNAKRYREQRARKTDPELLISGILQGDRVALSRAITLIESKKASHREVANTIINACLPHASRSVRIGITGVPGVGKSSFIEAFGKYLVRQGKKLAVLAVDPSSTRTHGSILGDKTRMQDLVLSEDAFIRPSPSGETAGGVARKTRETIILCEAAGFDTVIIETVGVGQGELAVHSMVDFFLLLKLAGAGDELQGIKRGIMEMADSVVINKCDGTNVKPAKKAQGEFKRALHLYPPKPGGWQPEVLTASALEETGIEAVWHTISECLVLRRKQGIFETNRREQNRMWLRNTIEDQLLSDFYGDPKIRAAFEEQLTAVENNTVSPFAAAQYLLGLSRQ